MRRAQGSHFAISASSSPVSRWMCRNWFDPFLPRHVARQQERLFAEIEGVVWMDRAQRRMQRVLQPRLGGIRDHQVGPSGQQFVEDAGVVGEHHDLGQVQMGAVERLVGAAGVDDDAHARPVDLRKRLEFIGDHAGGNWCFPVAQDRGGKERLRLPLERHRHAAGADVEAAGEQIGQQLRPACLHQFQLHAEGRRHRPRLVHVQPLPVPGRGIVQAERAIVAGHPDPQRAGGEDRIQPRRRRLRPGRRGGQQTHQYPKAAKAATQFRQHTAPAQSALGATWGQHGTKATGGTRMLVALSSRTRIGY